MTLLGLDFDTLVRYNELFYQLAVEKGLIKESIPICKTTIRLITCQGKDEEFTLLQGEVYGLRILDAGQKSMLELSDCINMASKWF